MDKRSPAYRAGYRETIRREIWWALLPSTVWMILTAAIFLALWQQLAETDAALARWDRILEEWPGAR